MKRPDISPAAKAGADAQPPRPFRARGQVDARRSTHKPWQHASQAQAKKNGLQALWFWDRAVVSISRALVLVIALALFGPKGEDAKTDDNRAQKKNLQKTGVRRRHDCPPQ